MICYFVLYILYFMFKHLKYSKFDKNAISAIQFENEEPMNTLKKEKYSFVFCNISRTFE